MKRIKVSWAEQESNLYLILRRDALCPLSYQSVQTEFSIPPSVPISMGEINSSLNSNSNAMSKKVSPSQANNNQKFNYEVYS